MLAARRGSGTAAKAAARLVGETTRGASAGVATGTARDVDCTAGSFAGDRRIKHAYPRKRARSLSALTHKPYGEGWLTGCRELSEAADSGSARLRRSLLLTDGLANIGITDPAELTHHTQ